jgi:hypothetical protein
MKADTATDHFDEMTSFLGREAKLYVLDSLACVFHNEGYNLEGNTVQNDTRWLANRISQALHEKELDRLTPAYAEELLRIAAVAKDSLPDLADRMASRYIRISKAIRTVERIAQQQGRVSCEGTAASSHPS